MQSLDRQSLENVVKRLTVRSGRSLRTVMSTNTALRASTIPTLNIQKAAVVERVKAFADAFVFHMGVLKAIGSQDGISIDGNDSVLLRFPGENVVLRLANNGYTSIQVQVWAAAIASMKPATNVSPGNLLKKLKERNDLHLCKEVTVRSYTTVSRKDTDADADADADLPALLEEVWRADGEHISARLSTDATFKAYLASLRALQKTGKAWVKLTAKA